MAFVVLRNSAIIFQLPRSPRSEGNTCSSAWSLTHHGLLHFALYSTKAFQKTYWYDKGRKAKSTYEVSVFEVPELARIGEGIPRLSSSHEPCWKYLKINQNWGKFSSQSQSWWSVWLVRKTSDRHLSRGILCTTWSAVLLHSGSAFLSLMLQRNIKTELL